MIRANDQMLETIENDPAPEITEGASVNRGEARDRNCMMMIEALGLQNRNLRVSLLSAGGEQTGFHYQFTDRKW